MTDNTIETTDEGESDAYIEDPTITEEEVQGKIMEIELILESGLVELNSAMIFYQEQWDKYGLSSIAVDFLNGARDGAAQWAQDVVDSFDLPSWRGIRESITGAFNTYVIFSENVEKAPEKVINTIWEWHNDFNEYLSNPKNSIDIYNFINSLGDMASEGFDIILKAFEHFDEIRKLPILFVQNDVEGIQKFVDDTLFKISPELANAIKNNAEFHLVLALLKDPVIILTLFEYVNLFKAAVPPNFFSYAFGFVGAYIVLELILTICLALLSGGSAVAARIAMFLNRLNAFNKLGKMQEKLVIAFNAYIKMVECIFEAIERIVALGYDLGHARSKQVYFTGKTTQVIKRDVNTKKRSGHEKCLLCNNKKDKHEKHPHKSPHGIKKGTLQIY